MVADKAGFTRECNGREWFNPKFGETREGSSGEESTAKAAPVEAAPPPAPVEAVGKETPMPKTKGKIRGRTKAFWQDVAKRAWKERRRKYGKNGVGKLRTKAGK